MTEVHKFGDSLKVGEKYEKILDAHFSQWFDVQEVSMEMQKLGVDRLFTKPGGERYTVEYKTDVKAGNTGNIAIETVSVGTEQEGVVKHGWAVTSTAQLIMLYIPAKKLVYILDTIRLRDKLVEWAFKYKDFTAQNEGYFGAGILVPEIEIAKVTRGRTTLT